MLCGLTIKNVVLIDQLSIAFENGFCVLTGETGAGKSILLDSLGLALGARSESGLVRKGADQAAVTAEFHVPEDHPVLSLLAEQGLDADTNLVLRRAVKSDGRSRAFINDQPVSIGLLKQTGDLLVEIHGQFETQGLLDPKTHRLLFDEYAGVDNAALQAAWDDWQDAREKLAAARAQGEKARAEELYLRQAVEDLDALAPEEGEEDRLAALREKLMRRDQVMESLNTAWQALGEAETPLGVAARALEKAGDDAGPLLEALERAGAEIQDVIGNVQSLSTDLEENEYSLEDIDDRLFALRGQARKHECTVDDLPRIRDELAQQLDLIDGQEQALAGLGENVTAARAAYVKQAGKAGQARRKAADRLDGLVAKELPPLKLEKARFVTQVDELDEAEWGPAGRDRVRFLVATNPGSEPGPLNKIASGGEMARFMLALKVVLAEIGAAGSLVFDEVDSGIGGATASAVGERLAKLAQARQILVVTHSPQVAARGGHHWIVIKDGSADITTKVIPLPELDKRREEIARMLAGAEVSAEARAAADKLLETGTG